MQIIPAILAQSMRDFEQKINAPLMETVPWVHIDVMDGTFTTQTCISHPGLMPSTFAPSIELHLMVQNPLSYIREWLANPQFARAIIHIESPCDHTRAILELREHKKEPSLAISPHTPLDALAPLAHTVNHFLVMGVVPGASGQPFLGELIFERIRTLRTLYPNHTIALDGGISASTLIQLKKEPIDAVCASSSIWNAKMDAITAYRRLSYL